jgi:hypothetical protein
MSQRLKELFNRIPLPGRSSKKELKTSQEGAKLATSNVESGGLGDSDASVEENVKLLIVWPPVVNCSTPLGAIRDGRNIPGASFD